MAAEKPDFVYTAGGKLQGQSQIVRCNYTTGPVGNLDSCGGCIFGQALQRLGISVKDLQEHDERSIDSIVGDYRVTVPRQWGDIQSAQDQGQSWGTAIKYLD